MWQTQHPCLTQTVHADAPGCAQPPGFTPPLFHSPCRRYDVSVVGFTGAKPSPPSNSLSFVTPAANAPLNTGAPKSPNTVVIKLVPPTIPPANGGSW